MLQVVPDRLSDAAVEKAFVDVFPKNVWSCDIPGSRAWTIGSSWFRWLKPQETAK
jgi:hypothetical protein